MQTTFNENNSRSKINPQYFLQIGGSLVHLYADDEKIVLVLEGRAENTSFTFAIEANIRLHPLSYQSDLLSSDNRYTSLIKIQALLTNLEHRTTQVIPASHIAIFKQIFTQQDQLDLINPSRQDYLRQLYFSKIDDKTMNIDTSVITNLTEAAEKPSQQRCNIM